MLQMNRERVHDFIYTNACVCYIQLLHQCMCMLHTTFTPISLTIYIFSHLQILSHETTMSDYFKMLISKTANICRILYYNSCAQIYTLLYINCYFTFLTFVERNVNHRIAEKRDNLTHFQGDHQNNADTSLATLSRILQQTNNIHLIQDNFQRWIITNKSAQQGFNFLKLQSINISIYMRF